MKGKRQMVSAFRPAQAGVRRPHRGKLIFAGAAVLVLAAAGTWWFGVRGDKKPAFREYKLARGNLKLVISAAAEVRPQNRIEIKPPLAGRIEKIMVEEGDVIKKGQVLAWLSSTDRAALLDAARAKGPEEAAKWEDVYRPTPLVAPLSGFIIGRFSEPGQTVSGGSVPLVMADRLIVRAEVDETDMGKIKIGQKVDVNLDAYPEIRMPGRVDHLAFEARTVNNVTVYDLEIELLKNPEILRSGMTATVDIVVARSDNVVLAPAEALTESKGKLFVTLKGANGQEKPVPVEIGLSDGAYVEIVKGAEEGATLLISWRGIGPSSAGPSGNPLVPGGGRRRR